jgi:hypothetical protein
MILLFYSPTLLNVMNSGNKDISNSSKTPLWSSKLIVSSLEAYIIKASYFVITFNIIKNLQKNYTSTSQIFPCQVRRRASLSVSTVRLIGSKCIKSLKLYCTEYISSKKSDSIIVIVLIFLQYQKNFKTKS